VYEPTKLWKRQALQQTMNDGYQSPGSGPAGFLEGEGFGEQHSPTLDPSDDFSPRLGGRFPAPRPRTMPGHFHGTPWDLMPRRRKR